MKMIRIKPRIGNWYDVECTSELCSHYDPAEGCWWTTGVGLMDSLYEAHWHLYQAHGAPKPSPAYYYGR